MKATLVTGLVRRKLLWRALAPLVAAATLLATSTVASADGGRTQFILITAGSGGEQEGGKAGGSSLAVLDGGGSVSVAAFRATGEASTGASTGLLLYDVPPGKTLDVPAGDTGLGGKAFDFTKADAPAPPTSPAAGPAAAGPAQPGPGAGQPDSGGTPLAGASGIVKAGQLLNRDAEARSAVVQAGQSGKDAHTALNAGLGTALQRVGTSPDALKDVFGNRAIDVASQFILPQIPGQPGQP
ncbi:MAG: hypothetical protein HYY32_03595, partial [Chloroflexi bacterium]|nr:hypothetical protein [Chloroflexota bacterium]